MKLDLKSIVEIPGASISFDRQLDLTAWEWNGTHPVAQPVTVCGTVRNMAGALVLNASMKTRLSLSCDRCNQPFERDQEVSYETLLATELEDEENDEIILLEDDQFELDELMTDVFLLSLDTKNLCKEDCRGLCPGCGVDLNVEPCRCKKEIDPRLAGLAKFFEK